MRRAFAGVPVADLDPFVHMDQMGEVEYAPGEPKGTAWHPHRGFETVTYMLDGTFQHQDSIGGGGLITNGSTQWMTAGSGILHIERPPDQLIATGGLFHGIQLWVNLPAADKWIDPRYQGIEADNVLLLTSPDGGALIRVIAGDVAGHDGPGSTHTPISLVHATVEPGAELVLPWPREFNALVYGLSGSGTVGPEARPFHTGQLAVFGAGDALVAPGGYRAGIAPPRPRRPDPRRTAHRRARLRPRSLRHEHPGRDHPGLRGLRGRQARNGPGRPHRQRVTRIAGSEVTGGATWGAADIGDLTGRIALVTGANSGIGYQTAAALADARCPRDPGLSRRGEGAPGARQDGERARALLAGAAPPRSGRPRVRARGRRCGALRARPAGHPGEQRRRHGHPVPPDRRRLRAADGDQPPRPFRPDRACCSTAS